MLSGPDMQWEDALTITVQQESSTTTSKSTLSCGRVLPAWLIQLRSVACLKDTHGNLRTPPELLLRTPETESLLNIEPFVEAELDDAPDKKRLLRLLGVRDSATSWEKVVDRLRGLTKIKDTMRVLADVLRLYEALDRIAMRCSTEDLNELRAVFAAEALVLSSSLEWFSSGELSLHANPEDEFTRGTFSGSRAGALVTAWCAGASGLGEKPGMVKDAGCRNAAGWRSQTRVGGADSGGRRVWEELGHWLSWTDVGSGDDAEISRFHAQPDALGKTHRADEARAADRMLHGELAEEAPFTPVRRLAEAITMQVTNVQPISGQTRRMEGLRPLADGLCRVKLSDGAATARCERLRGGCLIRPGRLAQMEVTPYIDGTPAGEPLMPKVLWSGSPFIWRASTVRLLRELKEELTRPFGEWKSWKPWPIA